MPKSVKEENINVISSEKKSYSSRRFSDENSDGYRNFKETCYSFYLNRGCTWKPGY